MAGGIYHVVNRGNGRQQVLHCDEDYQAFIDLRAEAQRCNPVELFA